MAAGASAPAGLGVGAHVHRQLTRSLERILDEATLSGELRLSGRKLKDFPNTGDYDLADTVIADLSKNRFGEVPNEVTAFFFLERLFLYHNAIRTVPDSIGGLQSLSYLDLSRNQLSEVPRELCLLSLQVLLLSNNKLTSLPKEIGKMSSLTELDASGNQITQLPMTIGDLLNLRALNLKNNQLGLLPLQITYLRLEILDISCNCISSLPMELRQMSSLVTLNLEHNPLVFPPAMVCVRGRIHIFKYLENQSNKDMPKRTDEARKSGKNNISHMPYMNHNQIANTLISDGGLRHKNRYNVDSGYSTSEGGEKRWSSDGIVVEDVNHVPIIGQGSGRSTPSTPSTISPGPSQLTRATSLSSETTPVTPNIGSNSPDGLGMLNGDDKAKLTATQQTYRQYKEALRQQRQQDVYRPRGEQISPPSTTPSTINQSYSNPHSPVANGYHKNLVSSNTSIGTTNSQNSPTNTMSSAHSTPRRFTPSVTFSINGTHPDVSPIVSNLLKNEESSPSKRPIQKVVPSRNANKCYSPTGIPVSSSNNSLLQTVVTNGNSTLDYTTQDNKNSPQDGGYIKPLSPIKGSSSFMSHNNVPVSKSNSLGRNYKTSPTDSNGTDQMFSNGSPKLLSATLSYVNNTKPTANMNPMRINWNKDILPDKLSFTMKREFDRAKEESELIQQLRSIIENRLKMSLPRDLAPVLADGVVLCHLANNVRPRSVASVHVPSATQPKLTMARCRRNVDNFLEACRKIGVEEGMICQPQDILPQDQESSDGSYERIAAIYKTVTTLVSLQSSAAHATENHDTIMEEYEDTDRKDNNENHFVYHESHVEINNYNVSQSKLIHRSRYAEDRCISNFNTFGNDVEENVLVDDKRDIFTINEINEVNFQNNNENVTDDCFNNINDDNGKVKVSNRISIPNMYSNKVNYVVPLLNDCATINRPETDDEKYFASYSISERINYFNGKRMNMNLDIKNNLNTMQNESLMDLRKIEQSDKIISWLCTFIFIFTLILLYICPLPN